MSAATATAARPRGGRPRNEDSPTARLRNLRWWLLYTVTDLTMADIAAAEREPTSESTVSRGIAEAGRRLAGYEWLGPLVASLAGATP